jgi:hypothetical protein
VRDAKFVCKNCVRATANEKTLCPGKVAGRPIKITVETRRLEGILAPNAELFPMGSCIDPAQCLSSPPEGRQIKQSRLVSTVGRPTDRHSPIPRRSPTDSPSLIKPCKPHPVGGDPMAGFPKRRRIPLVEGRVKTPPENVSVQCGRRSPCLNAPIMDRPETTDA